MKSQDYLSIDRERGSRLRSVRQKLALNQTEMAALGGVKLNTQSRYENGDLPSTEYLLRIGEGGADWIWVVTGQRANGLLDPQASQLVNAFSAMPQSAQAAMLTIALQLAGQSEGDSVVVIPSAGQTDAMLQERIDPFRHAKGE